MTKYVSVKLQKNNLTNLYHNKSSKNMAQLFKTNNVVS